MGIRSINFYKSRFRFIPEFERISRVPDKVWFKWLDLIVEVLFI